MEHDTCIVGSRVLVDGSTHPFSDSLILLLVLNLIFTILHSKKVIDTMHPFLEKLGVNYKKLKKNLDPPSASAVSNFDNLNWRCITYDYDNKENHSYHNCDNGK